MALLGAPFLHRGRSASGTDCIGLVILVGKQIGAIPQSQDYLDYERSPRGTHFKRLGDHFDRIRMRQARTGSVVVLKRRMPCHVGILLDDKGERFIHAFENRGAVVVDDLRHYLSTALLSPCAVYDYRGLDG